MLLHERSEVVTASAYELLLDSAMKKLPIDVVHIAEFLNIKVIDNSQVNELKAGEWGLGIFDGSRWNIVYDSNANIGRIRFTIAHELGHIVLGHGMKCGGQIAEPEREADLFAARLLAPLCVLQELGAYSASSISLLCNLSRSCAELQSETMINLLPVGKREYTDIERQLIEKFQPFIKNNRLDSFVGQPRTFIYKAGRQGLYKAVNSRIRRRKNLSIED